MLDTLVLEHAGMRSALRAMAAGLDCLLVQLVDESRLYHLGLLCRSSSAHRLSTSVDRSVMLATLAMLLLIVRTLRLSTLR